MSWGYFDRVKDTTTTTGTGDITLAGSPPTGFQTFSTVYAVGDLVPYAIAPDSGSEWEVGRGVYSATNTLQRTIVLGSSNAGALVNFSAGTKNVWVNVPAGWVNDVDTHGQVVARAAFQAWL
jgi:hypothetical protein